MNEELLHSYIFTSGNQHPAVKFIKQFLNSHPRVSVSNLALNENFDLQTEAALLEYQKYKQLKLTDGKMNAETWTAMGADMLPAQIKIASTHDSNICNLLDGNSKGGGGRGLSAEEIKLAEIIYKTSIDYKKVFVHKGKYGDLPYGYGQPDNTFMTPNGEIYAPANVYSSDYALESDDLKATFIHEMCHVWQYQRNIKNVKTSAIIEWAWHGTDYNEAYYYKLEEYKDLKEFGLEQQAVIIEDYYRVIKLNSNYSTDSKGKTRNLNYPKDSLERIKNLLYKAIGKFIDNPGY